jgi:hypothetical protein
MPGRDKVNASAFSTPDLKQSSPLKELVTRLNYRNDISPPKNVKSLYSINLDLDSPRMKMAMDNLGITSDEL